MMQERIKLGDRLIQCAVDDYPFLADLDFYLGGVLNTPELEKRRKTILDANK